MLDFTKVKKANMFVKMRNGDVFEVRWPTKEALNKVLSIEEKLSGLTLADMKGIEELYALVAFILSNNMAGRKISAKELYNEMDIEDIRIFFNAYIQHVTEGTSDPN